MAKLKGPLFSLGAAGKLGNALVYFGWKGLNVVREYVIPSNPRTALQTTQRGYMTAAVAGIHAAQAWAAHPLGEADTSAYALWASVVQSATTWFNQAVRNWVDQLIAGLAGSIYTDLVSAPGANQITTDMWVSGAAPTAGDWFYGTSKTALVHSVAATVVATHITGVLLGLTAGVKYYFQFRPSAPAASVGANSGIGYNVSA